VTGATLLAASTTVVAALGVRPLGLAAKALTTASAATLGGVIAAAIAGRNRAAWSMSLVSAGSTVALYLAQNGRNGVAGKAPPS
jgi:allophanate hydrolase subunit 2